MVKTSPTILFAPPDVISMEFKDPTISGASDKSSSSVILSPVLKFPLMLLIKIISNNRVLIFRLKQLPGLYRVYGCDQVRRSGTF